MQQIKITTSNDAHYLINLENNSVSQSLVLMLKHLHRLPLRSGIFHNPYEFTKEIAIRQLVEYANKLGIVVDIAKLKSQEYLNYLHSIYEKNYNGNGDWLQYHEPIHLLEGNLPSPRVHLSYGELAGPLDRTYRYNELLSSVTDISAGDCLVVFSELGKTPYNYWRDGEPDNLIRLCELAKPRRRLYFQITIELAEHKKIPHDLEQFEQWFSQYKSDWCRHWGIPDWSPEQIFGGILIGHLDAVEDFKSALQSGQYPAKLRTVNDN